VSPRGLAGFSLGQSVAPIALCAGRGFATVPPWGAIYRIGGDHDLGAAVAAQMHCLRGLGPIRLHRSLRRSQIEAWHSDGLGKSGFIGLPQPENGPRLVT
jgi:hypothetical protein